MHAGSTHCFLSILPSCAQQHPSRHHHHRYTRPPHHPAAAAAALPAPPLQELGQHRVQMLQGQVLAAAAAATAPRQWHAYVLANERSWNCERIREGRVW